MTPEARAKRQARQREYMRRMRAAKKTAGSRLQPVSPVPAPMTSAKPENADKSIPAKSGKPTVKAQDLESYDDLSSQKAKALQSAWTQEVSDYLLEAITHADSPFTGAGLNSTKMLCFWFGFGEKIDRMIPLCKPSEENGYLMAIMLECLNRLTGEAPTGSAPALPGGR
jgi:hypothetical protein